MAVTVGNIVRITARLLLNNISDVVNVYHFVVNANTAADDGAFMDEVADALDGLYTLVNSSIHNTVSYVSVEGQNISDNELLPSRPWPVLSVGGNATDMLPEMVAACVFHRTLTPRVRAAKFLPPYGENQNVDGEIAAATLITMQSFGDSLTTGLTETNIGLDYVAFNRALMSSTAVVQALVPVRFRTQRRRRLGVGS